MGTDYGSKYASTDAVAAIGTEFRRLKDLKDAGKGPDLVDMSDEEFSLRLKHTMQNWEAMKKAMNERANRVSQNKVQLEGEREEREKFLNFNDYSIDLVSQNPFNGIRAGPLDQSVEALQTRLQQVLNVAPLSAAGPRTFRPKKIDLGTHVEPQLMGALYRMNGYSSKDLFLRIRQLFLMCQRLLGRMDVSLSNPAGAWV